MNSYLPKYGKSSTISSKSKEKITEKIKTPSNALLNLCYFINASDHWPNEYSVRQWAGRDWFNPRSSLTKDLKNGT